MLTPWSQRPTLRADLICIHWHMTSRSQGTFSREEEGVSWEQGCLNSPKDQEKRKGTTTQSSRTITFPTEWEMTTKLKAMATLEISHPEWLVPKTKIVSCKKDHKLADCLEFKSKSYDDHVQFAWSNYLIYKSSNWFPNHTHNVPVKIKARGCLVLFSSCNYFSKK